MQYLIFGEELCPKSGKTHYQGYVQLLTQMRFGAVKTLLGASTHIESARGSLEENQAYCSKDGNVTTWGEPKKSGERTDLQTVKKQIIEGKTLREIAEDVSSYQALRMAEKLITYVEPKRDWKPTVIWLWGPTGVGKSRLAKESCQDPWWSGKTLQWWQGYDAHKEVIIDDFRADFCTFHELLRILDRYPFTVETKGGSRQLLAESIYITSPFAPERVYANRSSEDNEQLLRRITLSIECLRGVSEVGGNTIPRP